MNSNSSRASEDANSFKYLVRKVQAGDDDAARKLFESYDKHVLSVVRRLKVVPLANVYSTRDFSQAVWASLFNELDLLNGVHESRQFIGLIMAIARNKVVDENRRRTQTRRFSGEKNTTRCVQSLMQQESKVPGPSELAVARERYNRLSSVLSDTHFKVLKMKLAGYSNKAIAEQMGCCVKTVRRWILSIAGF